MLFTTLLKAFWDELRSTGPRIAARRMMRSARALMYPRISLRLLQLLIERKRELRLSPRDLFFHLQYRHHLSKDFSARDRIEAITHHYEDEALKYLPSYRGHVYEHGGLTLWETTVGADNFSIRLEAAHDNRWEGALSVVLYVNDGRVSVMSFTCIDAALLGEPSGSVLFITRNQSGREPQPAAIFRAAFKQTTPRYFCLAALSGIAAANGMKRLAAISHRSHPAWEARYDSQLRNSYTEFWQAFHPTPAGRASAFMLEVPLAVTPWHEVRSKHRKRAQDRREAWSAVTRSAQAAVAAQMVVRPEHSRATAAGAAALQTHSAPAPTPRPVITAALAAAACVIKHAQTTHLEVML